MQSRLSRRTTFMSIPENHIIDYSWFFYYYDGSLLANSGFEDFTRVKVYVAYFTINHSYIFICWCSAWLLNSSKFHQKVRRKRSEKKVRVLFLKSTSSTIKQPTSKLKIIVVKYVKKYVAGLLAQLAKAPVLWSIRLQVRNPSLRFSSSCSAKDYVGAPAGLSNLFCGLSSIQ